MLVVAFIVNVKEKPCKLEKPFVEKRLSNWSSRSRMENFNNYTK